MVLDPIQESMELEEDYDSTEDMLWMFHPANSKLTADPQQHNDIAIFSIDAEALYPSLQIINIVEGKMDIVTLASHRIQ